MVSGSGGVLLKTGGGVTWTDRSPAFTGDLYAIAIKGSIANSWAVGQNGMIFRR